LPVFRKKTSHLRCLFYIHFRSEERSLERCRF